MTAEPVTDAEPEADRGEPGAPDVVQTIAVRGIAVRVSVRRGTGRFSEAPPLLLCNGIGISLEALQPFVDALDPERGVVRFDVPGVGGSPLPPFPYPIAGLASWVAAVMSKLGHRRFDVLGISWGGGLAQQLALQSRRRVRRVVLVATGTGCLMVPAHPSVLLKLSTPRRHRDSTYAATIAPDIYGGTMRTQPEAGADLLHEATRAGPKTGYYYQLAAMWGWSSLPFLGLIHQPTLVMGGDDDPIIPTVNPRMQARLIPGAQLHLYRGGHLGLLTEADELAPVVERFLDKGRPSER